MSLVFWSLSLIALSIALYLYTALKPSSLFDSDDDDDDAVARANRIARFLPTPPTADRIERARSELALTFATRAPIEFDVGDVVDDWASVFLSRQRAVVVRNSSAAHWPALHSWADPDHWSRVYKEHGIREWSVHAPRSEHVRMHASHRDHSLLQVANANFSAAEWREATLRVKEVLSGRWCGYLLLNMHHVPRAIADDVDVRQFFAPWAPPHQINAWITAPTVTTPLHYDLMNNFYVQVAGRKRFVLLPPDEHFAVHIHPAVHPSWRQSYLDLDNDTFMAQHAPLRDRLRAAAFEVVLEPGHVLFIPALWLHHVTTVGDEVSISVSIHSDTRVANLREQMMLALDRGVATHVRSRRARFRANAALASEAYAEAIDAMMDGDASDLARRCGESRWNAALWAADDRFSDGLNAERIESERRLRESASEAAATTTLDAGTREAMRALGAAVRDETRGVTEQQVVSATALEAIECDVMELMCAEILAETLQCGAALLTTRTTRRKNVA